MAGGGQGTGYAQGGQINNPLGAPNPMGNFNTQSSYNNFASPNQNFMQYPQQGQPNQQQDTPPVLSGNLPATPYAGGPDGGAGYTPTNMGFDNSGSDGGVGGQPVNQMQTPLQQGNKPINMSQFQPPQGLQIQGNPTSQIVQRPQQR